jgi:hypothetical protein
MKTKSVSEESVIKVLGQKWLLPLKVHFKGTR